MATRKVHLKDSQEALLLFGQHDKNLRALEQSYSVQIFGRGHVLSIRGAPGRVEKALLAIEEMRENLGKENRGVGGGGGGPPPRREKRGHRPTTKPHPLPL